MQTSTGTNLPAQPPKIRYLPTGSEIREAIPGFLLLVLPIAIIAELLWTLELHNHVSFFIDIFMAAMLGLLVANVFHLPAKLQPGLLFSAKWFLKLGIVLSGLKFTMTFIFKAGLPALITILLTAVIAIVLAMVLGRLFKLNSKIAALIAAGTAICGVTAIMATGPSIKANEEEVGVAIGTVLLWGTLGLLIYPLIAAAMHIPPAVYGSWTGASLHDLPQIVAAAVQGGGQVGLKAALFVKLVRIAFIIVVVAGFGIAFAVKDNDPSTEGQSLARRVWSTFPMFVLGFFVVVILNSVFTIPASIAGPLATWPSKVAPTNIASFCLVLAITGITLRVNRQAIRLAGIRALLTGLITWVVQSVVILLLAYKLYL